MKFCSLREQEEFQARLQLVVYDWFTEQFPCWRPEKSPNHLRASQSLVVPIPEIPDSPSGMLYFKSIFAPMWSVGDIEALQNGPLQWFLLVMNPCERFYECASTLEEIAARSQRLLIWRPDGPTQEETERLRTLLTPAPSGNEGRKGPDPEAMRIMNGLYVARGKLIGRDGCRVIGESMGERNPGSYISSRLAALLPPPGAKTGAGGNGHRGEDQEKLALRWAALLAGSDPADADPRTAKSRLLAWRKAHLEIGSDMISSRMDSLPEPFRTTRFWKEVRGLEFYLSRLQPLLKSLCDGSLDLVKAMLQISMIYNREESRLLSWKKTVENAPGLPAWLPDFDSSYRYLAGTFPTDQRRLREMRKGLLQLAAEPHQFLYAAPRDSFDSRFLEFKREYIEFYCRSHDEHAGGIDALMLHNLDMLSSLRHADQFHVARVRIISRWIHGNRCGFPVREVLEQHPRCHCNFSPDATERLAQSSAHVNALIGEGIEYFRSTLRRCSPLIGQDLKHIKPEGQVTHQIAALLAKDKMMRLEQPAIDILNKIIRNHEKLFAAEFRKKGAR